MDTGILLAALDADDRHHRAANAILSLPDIKIVPEPVVVETDWMIQRALGVTEEIAFLSGLQGETLAVEATSRSDRTRAAELVARYRDARIGYVDAAAVAIAERLKERRIATLDRRHFSMIRPRHVEAFELLP